MARVALKDDPLRYLVCSLRRAVAPRAGACHDGAGISYFELTTERAIAAKLLIRARSGSPARA